MSKASPISAKACTKATFSRISSLVAAWMRQTKRTLSRPVSEPWKPPASPIGQETRRSVTMRPLSRCSSPPSRRISVDLPAPFGPIRPVLQPSGIDRLKFRKMVRRPRRLG